jgi:ParB/RepB/Spo0J family partition protein
VNETETTITELGDINTDVSRLNMFTCDPRMVATDDETMGRDSERPGYADELAELAFNIYNLGQLQPVVLRTDAEDRLLVVAGNRRTQAVQMVQRGFERAGTWCQKPGIRLVYTKLNTRGMNAEDLRLRNVAENVERVQLTVIDKAREMLAFLNEDGYTTDEVAAVFKVSAATVGNYVRMLELSREHQNLVATGALSIDAAIKLLELKPKERKAAVAAAVVTPGAAPDAAPVKVSSAAITQAVRDNRAAVAAAQPASNPAQAVGKANKPTKLTRTWPEVRNAVRNQDPQSPAIKDVLAALLGFADGAIDGDAFAKAVTKLDNLIADAEKLVGNVTAGR